MLSYKERLQPWRHLLRRPRRLGRRTEAEKSPNPPLAVGTIPIAIFVLFLCLLALLLPALATRLGSPGAVIFHENVESLASGSVAAVEVEREVKTEKEEGGGGVIPGTTTPSPSPPSTLHCRVLEPRDDAVVFWPDTLPDGATHEGIDGELPATARGAAVAAYWSVSLCTGSPYPGFEGATSLPPGTISHCPGGACQGALVVQRLQGCPASAACGSSAWATQAAASAPGRELLQQHHQGQQRECGAEAVAAGVAAAVGPVGLLQEVSPPRDASPALAAARALGPDDLYVVMEGGEFLSPAQVHLGGCRYAFPFHATIPGTYRVLAMATRTDWRSLNESIPGYPPLTRDDMLGERVLVEIGGGQGQGDSGVESASEAARAAIRMAATGVPPNSTSSSGTLPPLPLPLCTPQNLLVGRFVRSVSVVGMFDPPAPHFWSKWWVDRDPPNGLGARYWTDLSKDLYWTPYACREAPLNLAAARAFLVGQRMNFRGDSHLRLVYNHMMRVVCGSEQAASKDQRLTEDLPRSDAPLCPGLVWAGFTHDDMGGQVYTLEPQADPPNLLVINFGQHHASGRYRTPLLAYEAALESYWKQAEEETARVNPRAKAAAAPPLSSPPAPLRVIWVETFPQCVRNDAFVWGFGDWRTPARISLYNDAGMRMIVGGGHVGEGRALDAYVGVHDMLTQLCDVCPDSAHFIDVFPVLDFLASLMLRHLGGDSLFDTS